MAKVVAVHPSHAHHQVHERRRSVVVPALLIGGLVAAFGLAFLIRKPVAPAVAETVAVGAPVVAPPQMQAGQDPQAAAAAAAAPADDGQTNVYFSQEILTACQMSQPSIYFATNSARLGAGDKSALQSFVDCIRTGALVGRQVELVGHTDARGTAERNVYLGQRRADIVSTYLRDQGVPPSRLITGSVGEQQAGARTPEGMAAERRVDVRLIP